MTPCVMTTKMARIHGNNDIFYHGNLYDDMYLWKRRLQNCNTGNKKNMIEEQ